MYYSKLKKKTSRKIWKKNLEQLEKENIRRIKENEKANKPSDDDNSIIKYEHKEIMDFAKQHWDQKNRWNGRQIKNAFQTAIALAEWDRSEAKANYPHQTLGPTKLEIKHFNQVAIASEHFERYLEKVRESDSARAKAHENRYDTEDEFRVALSRARSSGERNLRQAVVNEQSDDDSGTTSEEEDSEDVNVKKSSNKRDGKKKDDKKKRSKGDKESQKKRTKKSKKVSSSESSSSGEEDS